MTKSMTKPVIFLGLLVGCAGPAIEHAREQGEPITLGSLDGQRDTTTLEEPLPPTLASDAVSALICDTGCDASGGYEYTSSSVPPRRRKVTLPRDSGLEGVDGTTIEAGGIPLTPRLLRWILAQLREFATVTQPPGTGRGEDYEVAIEVGIVDGKPAFRLYPPDGKRDYTRQLFYIKFFNVKVNLDGTQLEPATDEERILVTIADPKALSAEQKKAIANYLADLKKAHPDAKVFVQDVNGDDVDLGG